MSDLLKEAIADAKAVRETALQNAKMALQEAFTPHLKSMLSAKLREDDDEFGDEEEYGGEEEVPGEEEFSGEEEIPVAAADEIPGEEDPFAGEEEFGGEEEVPEEEPEVEEEGIIEIDGVKYAPIVSEDEEEFGDDEEEVEEDLDLESVIKELESELSEGDGDEDLEESDNPYDNDEQHNEYKKVSESTEFEIDESLFKEEDEDEEDLEEEVDQSSGIGKGTGRGSTDKTSGIGTANKKLKEANAELKEYKEAVKFLKDKLHEVNILNAKLLFTNKVFKEFALSNDQKMKVVENFDRAHTTREIKLVYSTLCENLQNKKIKSKSINEGASAKSGSTKPNRKIISEETKVANRFKKLANIR
jgi:hypothetical protein